MKTTLIITTFFAILLSCGCNTTSQLKETTPIKAAVSTSPQKSATISFSNTTWRTHGVYFFDKKQTEYLLSEYSKSEGFGHHFGCFIDFNEDGTFRSYYNAQCGNDCFTSSSGTYSITGDDELKIYVNLASQRGTCAEKTLLKNQDLGLFKITKEKDNSYSLKRI